MFDLRELLKEVGDRASRATEGPWDYQPWSQYALPSGDYAESILLANASDDGEIIRGLRDEDGEFIAHARTDVPALVATLEAVLELHKPVDVEPCDTICGECSYRLPNGRYMPTVEHPCPTVQAVNEVLGGTK